MVVIFLIRKDYERTMNNLANAWGQGSWSRYMNVRAFLAFIVVSSGVELPLR